MSKKIVVPEADYQPTEAELHEPVVVEPDTTPEQLAKALVESTEVERVSKEASASPPGLSPSGTTACQSLSFVP